MTMHNNFFTTIPLTHLIIYSALASTVSAFAFFHVQHALVIAAYLALLLGIVIRKKFKYLFAFIMCATCSLQIFFKINALQQKYQSHSEFLNKPVILQAKILHKSNDQLFKNQSMLALQTINLHQRQAGTLTTPLKISAYMPAKKAAQLKEGQTITIYKALLQQPTPGCEYERYLIKEDFWATTFITQQNICINAYHHPPWYTRCAHTLQNLLLGSSADLFNPIFLGMREKNLDTLYIQHQSLYWGICHHMARSGLHLIILFGLCMSLFHYLRIRFFWRYATCGVLLFLYHCISMPSISFIRALCMISFQLISKIQGNLYSSSHALALTTLLTVTYNPWYVLFLDFQLSFGITAVIIWFFHTKKPATIAFDPKTLVIS